MTKKISLMTRVFTGLAEILNMLRPEIGSVIFGPFLV